MKLQPANAARGIVALTGDPSNTSVFFLAPGSVINGPVPFETLAGVDLLPGVAQVFRKTPLTAGQTAEALPLLSGLRSLYKQGATPNGYYTQQVFGNDLADPKGIDLAQDTLDRSLWIALLAPKPDKNAEFIDAIGGTGAVQRILNIGFVPALEPPDPFADIGPRAAVQATWYLSLKPGSDGKPRFDELKVFDDTTQGLTRIGW